MNYRPEDYADTWNTQTMLSAKPGDSLAFVVTDSVNILNSGDTVYWYWEKDMVFGNDTFHVLRIGGPNVDVILPEYVYLRATNFRVVRRVASYTYTIFNATDVADSEMKTFYEDGISGHQYRYHWESPTFKHTVMGTRKTSIKCGIDSIVHFPVNHDKRVLMYFTKAIGISRVEYLHQRYTGVPDTLIHLILDRVR